MPILKMRITHELLGGHVHMRVHAAIVPKGGYAEYTLGKCGDLVMRDDEFAMFRGSLDHAIPGGMLEIDFVKKQGSEGLR